MSHTRGDRDRSRHRARLSGQTATANAHVRVYRAAYVRIKPPSSSSHTLPAYLRNARIVRCGEHVQVSRGLRAGSNSKGCSPDVIPRCVVARRRSARDVSSTSSVCREDLRRFTRSVRRMYLLCSNASRVLHRTWTGARTRHVCEHPSSRHGHAVPQPAAKGTRGSDGRGHLAVRI